MRFVEIITESDELTVRQRWAHVFTLLVAVLGLLIGLNLRNQILNATTLFESPQAGIRAFYPQNWLLDTTGDYVFRVRDMSRTGYKTTIQVAVRPVGPDASERNIADRLTLDRLQTFTDYAVQPPEPYALSAEVAAQAIAYTYVSRNNNPFLAGIPTVVRGLDILTISGGQAIIITFRADRDIYDQEFDRFETFLERLEF